MRKFIFSLLFLLFCGQIFAQNLTAKKGTGTVPGSGSAKATSRSPGILKANIFAPLLGYSQFSLEKSIGRVRNIEFGLGIVGAGKNLNIQPRPLFTLYPYHHPPGHKNQFGGFVELGYKFIKPFHSKFATNYNTDNYFEGSYIKPSFLVGAYSFNQFRDDSTTAKIRKHHTFSALMLNLGHQWVFDGKTVLDLYIGGGPEIDNVKEGDDLYGHPFVLAVAKDNPNVNIAVTAGFRLGFLFK